MATTTSVLALTTTFTPDPGCTDVYLRDCTDGVTCVGNIYQNQARYCLSDPTTIDIRQSCYPETRSESEVFYTYSPGLICPHGMTTAASAISPNGVWCCPSSLSWVGYPLYCGGLMTEGSFITTTFQCDVEPATITFGPGRSEGLTAAVRPADGTGMLVTSTIPVSDIVLSVYAVGVFLSGQTWSTSSLEPTSSTSSGSSETAHTKITLSPTSVGADQEVPSDEEDTSGPSRNGLIGAIVGSILGAALLLGLGFFLVRRHRNKNRERTKISDYQDAQGNDKHFHGHEHELEGTQGDILYKWRPELDGNSTRAELDNSNMVVELDVYPPVELDATGLYAQGYKPKDMD